MRWAWSNRKWCWRTSSFASCHTQVHNKHLWEDVNSFTVNFPSRRGGECVLISSCALRCRLYHQQQCGLVEGELWYFLQIAVRQRAAETQPTVPACKFYLLWTWRVFFHWCELMQFHSSSSILPFHGSASGSPNADSQTAGRAAGSAWTFSSRQGADPQHDLRSPDRGSEQDGHPRLPVQPDSFPQNGTNEKKYICVKKNKSLIHVYCAELCCQWTTTVFCIYRETFLVHHSKPCE